MTPIVDLFAKDATGGVFGAPIRYWDGNKFVAVGKAFGHGWYYCPWADWRSQLDPRDWEKCRLAEQINGNYRNFTDWLYVAPAGAGSKVRSLPTLKTRIPPTLSVPRNFFVRRWVNGTCVKVQIQKAYIPSLGRTLLGPPEDENSTVRNHEDRKGWCVFLRDNK
eukprot:jgi/Mesvir1/5926/Mv00694-RA.1